MGRIVYAPLVRRRTEVGGGESSGCGGGVLSFDITAYSKQLWRVTKRCLMSTMTFACCALLETFCEL